MTTCESSNDSDSSDDELIMKTFFQRDDDDDEIQLLLQECRFRFSQIIETNLLKNPSSSKTKETADYIRTINKFTDKEFKENFGLSRNTFNFVSDIIGKTKFLSYSASGRKHVPPSTAILMGFYYLSAKRSFRELSRCFRVTVSCAYTSVSRVINSLVAISSQYIQWPDKIEAVTIEDGFFNMEGIHGILGSISCQYVMNDSNHVIPFQGIVDHRKKFIDVYCGETDICRDAKVLVKSPLYEKMSKHTLYIGENSELFLIGNSTYPNLPWLVTPFNDTGNLPRNEENFNYKHAASGIIVREAFSLLMGRFKSLQSLKNKNISFASNCIIAACVLHNICIEKDDLTTVDNVEVEYNEIYCNDGNDNRRKQLLLEMYS